MKKIGFVLTLFVLFNLVIVNARTFNFGVLVDDTWEGYFNEVEITPVGDLAPITPTCPAGTDKVSKYCCTSQNPGQNPTNQPRRCRGIVEFHDLDVTSPDNIIALRVINSHIGRNTPGLNWEDKLVTPPYGNGDTVPCKRNGVIGVPNPSQFIADFISFDSPHITWKCTSGDPSVSGIPNPDTSVPPYQSTSSFLAWTKNNYDDSSWTPAQFSSYNQRGGWRYIPQANPDPNNPDCINADGDNIALKDGVRTEFRTDSIFYFNVFPTTTFAYCRGRITLGLCDPAGSSIDIVATPSSSTAGQGGRFSVDLQFTYNSQQKTKGVDVECVIDYNSNYLELVSNNGDCYNALHQPGYGSLDNSTGPYVQCSFSDIYPVGGTPQGGVRRPNGGSVRLTFSVDGTTPVGQTLSVSGYCYTPQCAPTTCNPGQNCPSTVSDSFSISEVITAPSYSPVSATCADGESSFIITRNDRVIASIDGSNNELYACPDSGGRLRNLCQE